MAKTHLDRNLSATKTARPEGMGQALLRTLKATSRGLRVLFHHT